MTGQLTATTVDGSTFDSTPTYSLSVSFESDFDDGTSNTTLVSQSNQQLSASGIGIFTFQIPNTTTQLLTTIGFVVGYDGLQ